MVTATQFIGTNKRNEHAIDNWVIYQADEGIYFRHKDGANFSLNNELTERLWEFLDHGPQPERWDGTWNVSEPDDGWGLDFRTHHGSGGTSWGLAPLAYSAILKWRDIVRPRTKSEQIVIDLTTLKNVLEIEHPGEYTELITDAIQNIEDRIKNF